MAPAPTTRTPLDLIALACRRGPDDLLALARLARGEQLAKEEAERLRRSGLVRGGEQPRLAPQLIVPVLALEAALGLAGEDVLEQLLALLRGAQDRAARETLLHALAEQLHEQIDALEEEVGEVDYARLRESLDDLSLTCARLAASEADPQLVTRVAALCAKLVERIAERIALRRRRKSRERLPVIDFGQLELLFDNVPLLPRLLPIPGSGALARSLAGEQPLPEAPSEQRRHMPTHEPRRQRAAQVAAALASDAPVPQLYGGVPLEEALTRHAYMIGLGRPSLAAADRIPTAERLDGPAPLAWSTAIEPLAGVEQAREGERVELGSGTPELVEEAA